MSDAVPRRRLSSSDRRAEISLAARTLFAENGYHVTTTRELARAAGVSDALLYRHFTSKEDLLAHVVDLAVSQFSGLPPLERLAGLSVEQLLTRLGQGFLERVGDNLDVIKILIGENADIRDARFAQFIDAAARGLGSDLARRGVTETPETGYFMARTFFGSLISFVLLQRVLGMDGVHPIEPDVYLAQLVAQTVGSPTRL